jgi:DNA protecting protein DprA
MSIVPGPWAAASRWSGNLDLRPILNRLGTTPFECASPAQLASAGLNAKRVGQVSAHQATRSHCAWFHLGHPRYPKALLHLSKPPPVVWIHGDLELLKRRSLAVVGSRRCTPYGRGIAAALGRGCAEREALLVSGGAHGIDTAAHRGALDAGGPTVAVLAQGLERDPGGDAGALLARIRDEGGLLLTERLPQEPATRWAFPRRNRLIAALGQATVVVEAGLRSGALYTAQAALELGQDVYAVPGRIDTPASQGSNALLLEGAIPLVRSAQVLSGMEPKTGVGQRLKGALPGSPAQLSRRSRLPIRQVMALLSTWELTRQVRRLPSGDYELVP